MTTEELPLIAVTPYGRAGASSRVRVFDWLDYTGLAAELVDYTGDASNSLRALASKPREVLGAERDLRRLVRRIGGRTVLLSRRASPFSNGRLEAQLLTGAARGVYDFDDALMHSGRSLQERLWSKSMVWASAVRAADFVIAGNEYLAERATRVSRTVTVIPSCVRPEDYPVKADYELGGPATCAWIGTPATEAYLALIAPSLLAVHRSRGLRIRLISRDCASLGELDQMIDRVTWTPDGFAGQLATADFGIMPLEDSEWARGKCAYKLLQYGAAGLPLVGSPVGVNDRVLADADGLSPVNDDEWTEALISIIDEPARRRRARGLRARRLVERDFSFQAWAERWLSAVGVAAVA